MNHDESQIQQAAVKMIEQYFALRHPDLCLTLQGKKTIKKGPLYAIQNAYSGNVKQGARSVREGVKSGVPDLFLPIPVEPYSGLYIEVKTATGELKKNQKTWKEFLTLQLYRVEICRSAEEVFKAVKQYMEGMI